MKIDDLPDDPKFTIKAVASQTGIRPVTLRAWERRHDVLNPYRADNHYRLYSERDVAILRWLKHRIDQGISISNAVNELHSMTSNDSWPEALPDVPFQKEGAVSIPPEKYVQQLYQALIHHDENRSSELLRQIHASLDLMTICMEVLVPTLRLIGEAWYRGEIRVTTEHFASAYLRGKLLSLYQAYPSRRNAPSILIGCAPLEQHELGSLMLAVLLRSEGYRVEYLGPDIPIEDLVDYASYNVPTMIILSASLEDAAFEMRKVQSLLEKQVKPTPIFGYGGRAFDLHPKLMEVVAGNYLGSTFPIVISQTRDLIKQHNSA